MFRQNLRPFALASVSALLTLALAVPAGKLQAAEALAVPLSVKELMVGAIEPTSNALWALGLEENQPKSEADWLAVEQQVIQLMAATAATSLGGSGAGEMERAQQEAWQKLSREMMELSRGILEAARARDYEATLDASNLLIEPCSACHAAFPPRQ